MGPPWDPDSGSFDCNSGNATTWGTERLVELAEASGGQVASVAVGQGGECVLGDVAGFLQAVAGGS